MNKKINKISVLAFLGLVGIAMAQEENYERKAAINHDKPQATLDIKAYKTDGTSKEGVLIPRLTKVQVANIASPSNATLVYISDNNYTEDATNAEKTLV